MKNVNKFLPFLTLFIGIGLAFSQLAFKPVTAAPNKAMLIYGYDQSKPLTPWVLDGAPGYFCDSGPDYCKYYFDTPPSNTPNHVTLRSKGIPVTSGPSSFGSYQQ